MSAETIDRILMHEIAQRRRGWVYLAGLAFAVAVVVTAIASAL